MLKVLIHDTNKKNDTNNIVIKKINKSAKKYIINSEIALKISKSINDIDKEIDVMTDKTESIDLNKVDNELNNVSYKNIISENNVISENNIISESNIISENNITIDDFKKTINDNQYVKKCTSNKEIGDDSLSYLVRHLNLSQSDKIKLGTGMEKILIDFILKYNPKLENIKAKKLKKGEKEKDHIFKDENNKIIYYAELKSNLNLDTEKSKLTGEKCLSIEKELKKKYIGYTIKMYLVNLRYLTKNDIPNTILNKYPDALENICGLNDYLNSLGVKYNFKDDNEYSLLLTHLVNKMFKKNN